MSGLLKVDPEIRTLRAGSMFGRESQETQVGGRGRDKKCVTTVGHGGSIHLQTFGGIL